MHTALLWHRSKSTTTLMSLPPGSPRDGANGGDQAPPLASQLAARPTVPLALTPRASRSPAMVSAETIHDVQDVDPVQRVVPRDQAGVAVVAAVPAVTAAVQGADPGDRLQTKGVGTSSELEH